jgi:hypothetical protein
MLEQDIRDTYRRMADADMPPARISIPAAGRNTRIRQRRRRAGLIAAPIFAAAAVLAIALAGVAVTGNRTPSGAPSSPRTAPAHFSPTRPYAWMPGLEHGRPTAVEVTLSRTFESVTYNASQSLYVSLSVDSAGQCHVQAGKLTCLGQFPGPKIATYRLGRVVGKVDGFPAYWKVTAHPGFPSSVNLSWQYAHGGWAQFSAGTLRDSLRLARTISFGTRLAPAVTFPVQLRSMPAGWQVNSAEATLWHGQLPAVNAFGAAPEPLNQPVIYPTGLGSAPYVNFWLSIGPGCPRGRTKVINGTRVTLGDVVHGVPQSLCTDYWSGGQFGLSTFSYVVNADPRIGGAASLFRHHLRVLGTDPADWTTRLFG